MAISTDILWPVNLILSVLISSKYKYTWFWKHSPFIVAWHTTFLTGILYIERNNLSLRTAKFTFIFPFHFLRLCFYQFSHVSRTAITQVFFISVKIIDTSDSFERKSFFEYFEKFASFLSFIAIWRSVHLVKFHPLLFLKHYIDFMSQLFNTASRSWGFQRFW